MVYVAAISAFAAEGRGNVEPKIIIQMKNLRYVFVFLLGLSLTACTSSITGNEEDDPIVKPPPPPPPPPPGGTSYLFGADATVGLHA